jgi:integrase
MALTEIAIRAAKGREKPYKMTDSGGLYLLVQPNGSKYWRQKYRRLGREGKLSIGNYPDISLREARKRSVAAKEQLAAHKDPVREKQKAIQEAQLLATNTFELVAAEYCERRRTDGYRPWAPATAKRCAFLLAHLYGSIGHLPVTDIAPIDVLKACRKLEKRKKLESARRALQLASAVFRYAVATARLPSDPTRDLKGALATPRVTHYAAILEPEGVGELLRAIDGYEGFGITKQALQLAAHTFVRPGELRHAEWKEIDFETSVWTIPAQKMKMRKPHHVPLSRQSLELLKEMRSITGYSGYVFPSVRSRKRPMSENTINGGLRRLGYKSEEMTGHGFRAMASTLLNESGKWSSDAIERALAHGDKDRIRAAYHRGAHWKERVEMAQWWSDYLDELREEGRDELKSVRKAGGKR